MEQNCTPGKKRGEKTCVEPSESYYISTQQQASANHANVSIPPSCFCLCSIHPSSGAEVRRWRSRAVMSFNWAVYTIATPRARAIRLRNTTPFPNLILLLCFFPSIPPRQPPPFPLRRTQLLRQPRTPRPRAPPRAPPGPVRHQDLQVN